jgi:hypothetical protein
VTSISQLFAQTAMTDEISTEATSSLGIKLTAKDVADAIVTALEPSRLSRVRHQMHFWSAPKPVSWQRLPGSARAGSTGRRTSGRRSRRLPHKRQAQS